MRLIDAVSLESTIQEQTGKCMIKIFEPSVNLILQDIRNAPTIDAEPVKHGRWESCCNLVGDYFKCSECEYKAEVPTCMGEPIFIYCPNCGAKMDGGAYE